VGWGGGDGLGKFKSQVHLSNFGVRTGNPFLSAEREEGVPLKGPLGGKVVIKVDKNILINRVGFLINCIRFQNHHNKKDLHKKPFIYHFFFFFVFSFFFSFSFSFSLSFFFFFSFSFTISFLYFFGLFHNGQSWSSGHGYSRRSGRRNQASKQNYV